VGKAKLRPKRKRPGKPAVGLKRSARGCGAPESSVPVAAPAPESLEEIARRQGVKPYRGVQDFAGIWPEEFDPDAFLEWLAAERRARREVADGKRRTGGPARKESA
jgi:hypothetical protein